MFLSNNLGDGLERRVTKGAVKLRNILSLTEDKLEFKLILLN